MTKPYEAELARLVNSEPNPRLRAQYARMLEKASDGESEIATLNKQVMQAMTGALPIARTLSKAVANLVRQSSDPDANYPLDENAQDIPDFIQQALAACKLLTKDMVAFSRVTGKAAPTGKLQKSRVNWQDDDSAIVRVGGINIVAGVGLTGKGSARGYVAIDGETSKYRFSKTGMGSLDEAKAWVEQNISPLADICMWMECIEDNLKQINATID